MKPSYFRLDLLLAEGLSFRKPLPLQCLAARELKQAERSQSLGLEVAVVRPGGSPPGPFFTRSGFGGLGGRRRHECEWVAMLGEGPTCMRCSFWMFLYMSTRALGVAYCIS